MRRTFGFRWLSKTETISSNWAFVEGLSQSTTDMQSAYGPIRVAFYEWAQRDPSLAMGNATLGLTTPPTR